MKAAFEAKRAEHKKLMLDKYDANKDGKLDAAERTAMRDDKLTERFQKMDAHGDGKLTLDEFKAAAPTRGKFHHGRHGHGRQRAGMKS
jgi:Ca2+-binding EF-hand superfamily protein